MQVVRWLRVYGGDRASVAWRALGMRGWINMASGWNDVADLFPGLDAGDLVDAHNYESPPRCALRRPGEPARYEALRQTFALWPLPLTGRALALGEYGGLGLPLPGHEWSPETSWAYGAVSHSAEDLAQRLSALAQRAKALLCSDLVSALVYTQWNDVEEEVNGLVSYDRRPKLPSSVLRRFNEQLKEVGLKR